MGQYRPGMTAKGHPSSGQNNGAEVVACPSVVCNYITTSPIHGDNYDNQETDMNTQISAKFAALAVALFVNGLMLSGVACLFNGQWHTGASTVPAVHNLASADALAKI
jgi:hypothetical protein